MELRRRDLIGGLAAATTPIAAQESGYATQFLTKRPIQYAEADVEVLGSQKATREASIGQPFPYSSLNFKTTGTSLVLPPGTFDVYQTIELGDGSPTRLSSVQSLSLTGQGCGANEGEFSDLSAGTLLRWKGPVGQPMIRVNGPIYAVTLRGMSLDCAGASDGIVLNHPINSVIENIHIRNAMSNSFVLQGIAQSRSGMAAGAGGNRITQVRVYNSRNAVGFILGADNVDNVGCSGNVFEQCSVLSGGIGWLLRFTDYIRLIMCQSYYTQIPMLIQAPSGAYGRYFPTAIYADHWSADALPQVQGIWTPQPNTGVVFTAYHREWNGGPAQLDTSFGPPFPQIKGFSGTDCLGTVYPHIRF